MRARGLGVEVCEADEATAERRCESRSRRWSARSFFRCSESGTSVVLDLLFGAARTAVVVVLGGLDVMKARSSALDALALAGFVSVYSITSTLASEAEEEELLIPDQSDSSASSCSSSSSSCCTVFCFLGSEGSGANFASKARRKMAWRSSAPLSDPEDEGDGECDLRARSARATRFRFPRVVGGIV